MPSRFCGANFSINNRRITYSDGRGLSAGAFFSRFNVLDQEDKVKSFELARSCVDAARLALAESSGVAAPGVINVGTESCNITIIQTNTPSAGQITVHTKAAVNQSVTNLEAVFNAADLSLISWQELPGL